MLNATLRWALLLVSLLAVGPFAYRLTHSLHDIDAGHAATLLVNAAPFRGILIGLLVFALAGAVGLIGSRFFALGTGMSAAGFVLAWAAWGLGAVEDILRRARSGHDLPILALEGLFTAALALLLAALFDKAAKRHEPHKLERQDTRAAATPLAHRALATLAAFIAGGAVLWLFCVTMLKGQTVVCAALAGLFGAAAAEYVAVYFGGSAGVRQPILGLALLALVGPLAARLFHSDPVAAAFDHTLLPIARPLSLDWAAGALLGVPIGLSWTSAMVERGSPSPAAPS